MRVKHIAQLHKFSVIHLYDKNGFADQSFMQYTFLFFFFHVFAE